ncbi:hypothetical protein CASFOL_012337 [Castilleja foliolosa]|uniref:Uncharacterized protein n=1 Tax=Castilleja foliolosa TaxID=1961234 RepID=A0ABD3DQ93_9LAMI
MGDVGEAPGPSWKDKGKAKLGEPSYFTSAHNQSERKNPGPNSRSLEREDMCLINHAETLDNPPVRISEDLDMNDVWDKRHHPVSKKTCYALRHFKNPGNLLVNSQSTRSLPCPKPSPSIVLTDVAPSFKGLHPALSKNLTSQDVDPTIPKLYIVASEAYSLTDCVKLLNPTPDPSHMMLTAFDEVERPFKMLLSHLSISRFTISGDWGNFCRREHLLVKHYLHTHCNLRSCSVCSLDWKYAGNTGSGITMLTTSLATASTTIPIFNTCRFLRYHLNY